MSSNTSTLATFATRPSNDGTGPEFVLIDPAGTETVLATESAVTIAQALDTPAGTHDLEQAVRTSLVDFMSAALSAQQEALRAIGVIEDTTTEPEADKPKTRRKPRTARAAAPAQAEAEPLEDAAEPELAAAPAPADKESSSAKDEEFARSAQKVAEFHDLLGRWPSSSSQDSDEKTLGSWLSNQRARGRTPAMSAERIALLDEVAPGWAGATAAAPTVEVAEPTVTEPVEQEVPTEAPDAELAPIDEVLVPSDVEPPVDDEQIAAPPAPQFDDDDAF